MIVGVHSDLHTEFSFCSIGNLNCMDLLILAGDIGDCVTLPLFFDYLRSCNKNLKIIYILGNHEFYGLQVDVAKKIYANICATHNVILLDDSSVIIDDILFVGSVLWSNFTLAGDSAKSMAWAENNLNDFRNIYYQNKLISAAQMLLLHQHSQRFIFEELTHCRQSKKVVISHFLPSLQLVSEEHCTDGLLQSAYWCSELPELYRKANLWIYGHSHDNICIGIDNTNFISNQRGYSKVYDLAKSKGYRRDFVIEI